MNGANTTAERLLIVDENESIMVVERELITKVDEQRGSLSRPEFLYELIERGLQEPEPRPYVSRDEFLEFAATIKGLLASFLDLNSGDNLLSSGKKTP